MNWMKSVPPRQNKWVFYFYLIQLIIPAIYLADGSTMRQVVIGFILIIFFAICYRISFTAKPKLRIIASILMMLIMWTLSGWMSLGYLAIIYYPAAVMSYLPKKYLVAGYSTLFVGTLAVVVLEWHRYKASPAVLLSIPVGVLFGAASMIFMIRYYTRIQTTNRELEQANAEIERLTKTAERSRISRDLHDVMGHQLSMITLKAQLATRILQSGQAIDRAMHEVADIEHAARQALTQVRAYVADMRQPDLALEWGAAQQILQVAGIECAVADPAAVHGRQGPVYAVLAMCLREAVTNIVRHSSAKNAALCLQEVEGFVHLWVADNGRGFEPEERTPHSTDTFDPIWRGNGMNGMRARVASIQGNLDVWDKNGTSALKTKTHPALPWSPSVFIHIAAPINCSGAPTEMEDVRKGGGQA